MTAASHALLIRKTDARVQRSRHKVYRAWRRVAASRRRILRYPATLGGADDLRQRVRVLLRDRILPPIDGRAWAGDGNVLNRCACCGEPIRATDKEFEPEAAAGTYAHDACMTIWRAESDELRGDGGQPHTQ